ncbi:uncharacterized protein SAPINGB_P000152 [Magnusiomyces paraingens]|uniref:AP-3 complex subunit delta n=1 Tax=Magnusiomyces paraingens TaxID=2606893 RepID=A0A5E8B4I3_9ASCO|nr:uncharacterized protein SAPINGB_P000152 [Saprochaete ingens]VVT43800.1 unnamed protein product [Saprochaete ingens]
MSLASRDEARNRLRPFGIVFEKNLEALIRGIRAAKDATSREKFLNDSLAECRVEAASPDMEVKTQAVLKLAYLEMYGYDMSWASFHVLEVMSSSRFQQKRIGYLAATQSFRDDTDVLMLTTNLLKKDLNSVHHLEIAVALGGAASIVTPSLAQDLSDDIIKMLNHSKPYIRKKAILAMYRVFLQYPEALRASFSRLKDKLSDPDPSVVSATVNVICELAKTNSKNYLVLAPPLYELLTTSSNNWMLIKILKLFSSLAPQEPRLKAKLIPPILDLINKTSATSLLYECINCIVSGGMLDADDYDIANTCVEKLRIFLETSDQNLKFVALLALSKIIKIHPQFVFSNEDTILSCVDDPDITIRQRALDMVSGVVNEDNISEIVYKLKSQLTPGMSSIGLGKDHATMLRDSGRGDISIPKSYRILVIRKIIEICKKDMYKYLPEFEWYVSILVELLQLADGADEVAEEIGQQLRDIAVRVVEVRDTVVAASVNIASRQYAYSKMPSALPSVLWVVGEYSDFLHSPVETIYTISQFLQSLSSSITGVFDDATNITVSVISIGIQALAKIFAHYVSMPVGWTQNRSMVIETCTSRLVKFFELYSNSLNFEIQERATEFLELFKLVQQALDEHPKDALEAPGLLTIALPSLFNLHEINPVAPGSQLHIPVPVDLDLDTEIYPSYITTDDSELFEEEDWDVLGGGGNIQSLPVGLESSENEWKSSVAKIILSNENENAEEAQRRKLERLERLRDDPFYISTNNTPHDSRSITPDFSAPKATSPDNLLDLDSIPVSRLEITPGGITPRRKPKTKVSILQDEFIPGTPGSDAESINTGRRGSTSSGTSAIGAKDKSVKKFQSAFRLNASGLESFDLNAPEPVDTAIEEEVQKLREKLAKAEEVPKKKKKKRVEGETKKKKSKRTVVEAEPTVESDNINTVIATEVEPAGEPAAEGPTETPVVKVVAKKKKKSTKTRKATIE